MLPLSGNTNARLRGRSCFCRPQRSAAPIPLAVILAYLGRELRKLPDWQCVEKAMPSPSPIDDCPATTRKCRPDVPLGRLHFIRQGQVVRRA